MRDCIRKGSEVKRLVQEGWELHYIAQKQCTKLPGNWELRRRYEVIAVSWDAIEQVRRGLKWWNQNTEEIQVGRNWVYRLKQASLNLEVAQ